MSDTSHRTTSEKQAVKRAKARAESLANKHREPTYFVLHRWLPKPQRKK